MNLNNATDLLVLVLIILAILALVIYIARRR